MFPCLRCPGTAFVDADALQCHEASGHPAIRRCQLCNIGFPTKNKLRQHYADKHIRCSDCSRGFTTQESLEQHLKNHCKSKTKSSSTGVGLSSFKILNPRDTNEPLIHNNKVDPDVPSNSTSKSAEGKIDNPKGKRLESTLDYSCDHCASQFYTQQALRNHVEDRHIHPCSYCNHVSLTEVAWHQHEVQHLIHKCSHCDWRFTSDRELEQHTRDLHSLQCNYCSSNFSSFAARNKHHKDCQSAPRSCYSCTPCNVRSWSLDALETHGYYVHGLTYWRRMGLAMMEGQIVDHPPQSCEGSNSPIIIVGELGSSPSLPSVSPGTNAFTASAISQSPCGISSGEPGTSISHSHPNCVENSIHDDAISILMGSAELDSTHVNTAREDYQAMSWTQPEVPMQDDRTRRYCPCCKEVFSSQEDRQAHDCKLRKDVIPLHCTLCFVHFEDEVYLERHMAERVLFLCQLCNLQFCSDSHLRDHMETHQTCRICLESFASESELYHRHSECKHPVVVCWDCGGAVVSQDNLESHCAVEHPSCTICGARMQSPDLLREHVRAEHGIEEPRTPDDSSNVITNLNGITPSPDEADSHDMLLSSSSSLSFHTPLSIQPVLDSSREELTTPSANPSVNDGNKSRSSTNTLEAQKQSLASIASPSSLDPSPKLIHPHDSIQSYASPLASQTDGSRGYTTARNSTLGSSSGREPPTPPVSSDSREPFFGPAKIDSTSTAIEESSSSDLRLHCRICNRDPCEDMTATICGHLFCKRCITQAVVTSSECPVCKNAILLYCLFRLDLTI